MESTGGTTANSKADTGIGSDKSTSIPKDHYRFFPSISEQGLGEKTNRKRL